MTRLMTALLNGDNLFESTTFHKGKGQAPAINPMIAPTAPVEEASVEIEKDKNKKPNTGKSSLKMPLSSSKDSGIKL